ncbi:MAG: hypothetical protein NTV98_04030 [Candidatus Roizmanbacteria bacterium]|nr:hypothetical protein [Candidatus Roizmanbacteria bacterium]
MNLKHIETLDLVTQPQNTDDLQIIVSWNITTINITSVILNDDQLMF